MTAEESQQIYQLNVIADDYIRTVKLPQFKSKNPVAVIYVGAPGSGKTYLTQKLTTEFPFLLISHERIQSFLTPTATFFERGQELIYDLVEIVIPKLISLGVCSLFDLNFKVRARRNQLRGKVFESGGHLLTIYLNCPVSFAFNQIQAANRKIVAGEKTGFVIDRAFFQFEVSTTEPPNLDENAINFDISKDSGQINKIIAFLKPFFA